LAARGSHDSLETVREVVGRGIAALAAGDFETVRELAGERMEHVTRDGVVFGPERLIAEFAPQLERWVISFYLEDLIDAGEGALIAILEVERRDRETGGVALKAWPAIVVRIDGGRFVFLEGYVDRRRALTALGVD
jgi:ketosteroid isomerase-like protein